MEDNNKYKKKRRLKRENFHRIKIRIRFDTFIRIFMTSQRFKFSPIKLKMLQKPNITPEECGNKTVAL